MIYFPGRLHEFNRTINDVIKVKFLFVLLGNSAPFRGAWITELA